MPNEHTPLLTTVRVGNPRQRYQHNVLRRFCTIALSSILISSFISFLVSVILDPGQFNSPHHHHRHRFFWLWSNRNKYLSHEEVQTILFDTPSAEKASHWSWYYTSGPHLAGKNLSQVCIRSACNFFFFFFSPIYFVLFRATYWAI
jgi:N-acetylated-alpha-linked acidic dipeptidase